MHNAVWLGRVLEEICPKKKAEYFPYFIYEGLKKKPICSRFTPLSFNDPQTEPSKVPHTYMIAMPCIPESGMDASKGHVQRIIKDIEDQTFHRKSGCSLEEVGKRAGLVIGLNTFYSMDSDRNLAFRKYVHDVKNSLKVRKIAVRIIPFFWMPWEFNSKGFYYKFNFSQIKYKTLQKKPKRIYFCAELLYPVDKCYTLVKSYLNDAKIIQKFDQALQIFEYFGNKRTRPKNTIIPYQEIRTAILHSREFEKLSDLFRKNCPDNLQYVVSLDADFASLKRKPHHFGLLSQYDLVLKNCQEPPHVMSTGYEAPITEEMGIIKSGIKLDRLIREAVAKTLPAAVYMPEPNFALFLPTTKCLKKFSFMEGQRSTMTAESRQLIKAAKAADLIDPSKIVFINQGAIQTTIDDEWRTAIVSKYKTLSRQDIYKQEVIKAFRGLHQSYADSQIWANNIYSALDTTVTDYKTNAIKPMKEIRKAFDPYELALNMSPQFGRYSSSLFLKALSYIGPFTEQMELALKNPEQLDDCAQEFVKQCDISKKDAEFFIALFKSKQKLITEAETHLKTNFTIKKVLAIRTIAIDTGIAVTKFFQEFE